MQVARVSASFRQGRTTENSTAAGGVRDSASAATELPVGARGPALVAEVVALGDVMTDRSFLSGPTGRSGAQQGSQSAAPSRTSTLTTRCHTLR